MIIILLGLLLPMTVAAGPQEAEAVVLNQLAVESKGGLVEALRFVHPDDLQRIKQRLMPVLTKLGPDVKKMFGNDVTVDMIRTKTGLEVVSAFIRLAQRSFPNGVSQFEFELIGSVQEKMTVNVLVRSRFLRASDVWNVWNHRVVSARPCGDKWCTSFDPNLELYIREMTRYSWEHEQ